MIASFLMLPHSTMPSLPMKEQDAKDVAAFIMKMKKDTQGPARPQHVGIARDDSRCRRGRFAAPPSCGRTSTGHTRLISYGLAEALQSRHRHCGKKWKALDDQDRTEHVDLQEPIGIGREHGNAARDQQPA